MSGNISNNVMKLHYELKNILFEEKKEVNFQNSSFP